MRRARRTDANQAEIVAALRHVGASVEVISDVGRGVPDLLIGAKGRNLLMEVKRPGESFTPDQIRWMLAWNGDYAVVRTPQEAIDALS